MGTIVNATPNNDTANAASTVTTVPATTVGNSMLAFMSFNTKTRTPTGVTDGGSNSGWTSLGGQGAGTEGSVFLYWLPRIQTSFTSITTSYNLSSIMMLGLLEVKGLMGITENTPVITGNTTTTTSQTSSYTPIDHPTMLFNAIGWSGASISGVSGNSWSLTGSVNGGGSGVNMAIAWENVEGKSTQTATFTASPTNTNTTFAVGFRNMVPPAILFNSNMARANSNAAHRSRLY